MSDWRAFAKLTLSLRVLGRRGDGYHELDALTVSVSEPFDDVAVALGGDGDRVVLELAGPATAGVTPGQDNLAVRAAQAVLSRVGGARVPAVHIALHKQIAAGAGLGGGSADAAAVLVALDRLLGLGFSTDELAVLAAEVGSDVAFCVRGGAAHMRGRGERIDATTLPDLHVLIAVPPFAIATPAVYRAWDELAGPTSTRVVEGPAGLGPLSNDLEPAAERVEPRLGAFRAGLEFATGAPAILAGSGSACVVLYDDEAAALAARQRVLEQRVASTCVVGVTRSAGVTAREPGQNTGS